MARRQPIKVDTLKRAAKRADSRALRSAIMLFQFTALVLLSLKTSPVDMQALAFSLILPAATYLVSRAAGKIWKIDRTLLLLVLFLCSVSVITLKDIAKSPSTPFDQAVYISGGLVVMIAAIIFIRKLNSWEKWSYWLMGGALVLLALPLVIGEWQYGAKNWIKVPGINISIQPSEFVKPILVIVIASCFSGRTSLKRQLLALAFAAAMCGLLLIERDLGALLLYFMTTVILFYVATSNLAVTAGGLLAGAGGAYIAYRIFPYVQKRVEVFVNPWADPLEKGYQIIQALIAIGSGGMFGMGLGLGMPRSIPLYHSDFVFAAICEEFGCVFALCLLAVYVLIIMRGVSIAMNARNGFHAMIAFGCVSLIGTQTLLIVGGNIKLIPLTGVTLPFIAAGGSSLLSCFALTGLLLGISSINAEYEAEDISRMEWREEDIYEADA